MLPTDNEMIGPQMNYIRSENERTKKYKREKKKRLYIRLPEHRSKQFHFQYSLNELS